MTARCKLALPGLILLSIFLANRANAETPILVSVAVSDSLPNSPEPQTASKPDPARPSNSPAPVTLHDTPMNILKDQEAIWTSPFHVQPHDLIWLVPLAAATGASLGTDHRAMTTVVSHDRSFNDANVNASNAMVGGMIAAPVALLGFGAFKHDEHAKEAGILGGEAMVDAGIVGEGLKLITWRERPPADAGRGKFWQSGAGIDSSFPSTHSLLAWSSAAVIAEEYPSHWTQLGVYSLATGVSLTRVLGQEHFPTDVLIGSATGWLIGHYVYRKHHRGRVSLQ